MKATPFALEQSCPEKKFSFHGLKDGDPIKIKGENDPNDRFQIYSVTRRDGGQPWDIFSELVGVVVFVNSEKHVYNIIIKRDVESFIHIDKVKGELREGSFVEVAISQYHSEQGKKYRIISIKPTAKKPDSEIYKEFSDIVTIPDNMEVGFTSNDIFIPSHIVRSERLTDGDCIAGDAVLSYNKKKSKWGWKAISVKKTSSENKIKSKRKLDYDDEYEDKNYDDNFIRLLKTPEQWLAYIQEQEQEFRGDGVLAEVSEDLKTPEFFLEAVRQCPLALMHVPQELITQEICLEAVRQLGHALMYVPNELKTQELCLAAIGECGLALEDVPNALKTPELCLAAVRQWGQALGHTPEDLITPELCLAAVKSDGSALEYVPEELLTLELCRAAVQQNSNARQFIPDALKNLLVP